MFAYFFVTGSCSGMQRYELGYIQSKSYRCFNWSSAPNSGYSLDMGPSNSTWNSFGISFVLIYKAEELGLLDHLDHHCTGYLPFKKFFLVFSIRITYTGTQLLMHATIIWSARVLIIVLSWFILKWKSNHDMPSYAFFSGALWGDYFWSSIFGSDSLWGS